MRSAGTRFPPAATYFLFHMVARLVKKNGHRRGEDEEGIGEGNGLRRRSTVSHPVLSGAQ